VREVEEKSILVIDDNEQTRAVIISALTREGYTVTEVADGLTAVAELKANVFNVVLLDFKMPHDGVTPIDYLAQNMSDVLARTIVFMPDVNRPIWGVLPKPIDTLALVDAVGACASRQ
jgi:CheY-like chemotaxis protein